MSGMKPARTGAVGAAKRKDKVVHARFSQAEFQRISDAAELSDMTVSAFIRSLALEGAGVKPFLTDEDRAVFVLIGQEVRAVGVNLSQVARALNKGRADRSDQPLAVIDDVQRGLAILQHELRALAERGARCRTGRV